MADVLDFCAYRRARGLPVPAAYGNPNGGNGDPKMGNAAPLDAETRRALRRWRCFEARLRQLDAAEQACVTVRAWGDAERGRPVSEAVRRRILATWTTPKSL